MFTLPLLLSSLALSPSAPPVGEVIVLWKDRAAPLATTDGKIDKPQMTLYKAEKPSGAAVVICPGGGYGGLAMDHEGTQVAEYFNKLGVHAFVLEYRIARAERKGPLGHAPMLDVNRAIRVSRSKAKDLGIDAKRIGLMGFSAGGHLASTGGTHFDDGLLKDGDDIDKVGCRPDFLILGYPVITMEPGVTHAGTRMNLIGKEPDPKDAEYFSNEKRVTKETPPTFIFHTDEDTAVLPENAIRFYAALKKAKVPAELHIYEKGPHGVGINPKTKSEGTNAWKDRLTDWLKVRGVLEAAK
jgi:acetyl esterase/lipase